MGTKEIWKYELKFDKKTELQIPAFGEVLAVQVDKKTNCPCLWVMIIPTNEKEKRVFELFGTGHKIEYTAGIDRRYIGTFQYQRGQFIGHVFERFEG